MWGANILIIIWGCLAGCWAVCVPVTASQKAGISPPAIWHRHAAKTQATAWPGLAMSRCHRIPWSLRVPGISVVPGKEPLVAESWQRQFPWDLVPISLVMGTACSEG